MARHSKFNPTVLLGKTVYLQRIQEAVAAGYCHAALGRGAGGGGPTAAAEGASSSAVIC